MNLIRTESMSLKKLCGGFVRTGICPFPIQGQLENKLLAKHFYSQGQKQKCIFLSTLCSAQVNECKLLPKPFSSHGGCARISNQGSNWTLRGAAQYSTQMDLDQSTLPAAQYSTEIGKGDGALSAEAPPAASVCTLGDNDYDYTLPAAHFSSKCEEKETRSKICVGDEKVNRRTCVLLVSLGSPYTEEEVPGFLQSLLTDDELYPGLELKDDISRIIELTKAKLRGTVTFRAHPSVYLHKQAKELERRLESACREGGRFRAMAAYIHGSPDLDDCFQKICTYTKLENLIIMPMFPQYSCNISGNILNRVIELMKKYSLPPRVRLNIIENYPVNRKYITCLRDIIRKSLIYLPSVFKKECVIIFAPHTLPIQEAKTGGMYLFEIGATIRQLSYQLAEGYPYAIGWIPAPAPVVWFHPTIDHVIRGFVERGKKMFLVVPLTSNTDTVFTLHDIDEKICGDLEEELGEDVTIQRVPAVNTDIGGDNFRFSLVMKAMNNTPAYVGRALSKCARCERATCKEMKKFLQKHMDDVAKQMECKEGN